MCIFIFVCFVFLVLFFFFFLSDMDKIAQARQMKVHNTTTTGTMDGNERVPPRSSPPHQQQGASRHTGLEQEEEIEIKKKRKKQNQKPTGRFPSVLHLADTLYSESPNSSKSWFSKYSAKAASKTCGVIVGWFVLLASS